MFINDTVFMTNTTLSDITYKYTVECELKDSTMFVALPLTANKRFAQQVAEQLVANLKRGNVVNLIEVRMAANGEIANHVNGFDACRTIYTNR